MAVIYSDYARDRIGWFFGVSGWQLGVLVVAVGPLLWAVNAGAWPAAAAFLGLWIVVLVVTVVPVRGRSATGWLVAATWYAAGSVLGWTRFRSRAATGRVADLDEVDLPGVLAAVQIHDGPPHGPAQRRIAVIQHHARRTWAVTAALTHPGIGMSEAAERRRHGTALADLLDIASRTELVAEVLFLVRTVPEDGADRDVWIARHRRPDGPALARAVNDDLNACLAQASVRTEAFVTVVVPESRIRRAARDGGGGLAGRAGVLYGVVAEIEAQLLGGMAMTSLTWLTSPQLAVATRTGFAPAERAGIIDAAAAHATDPGVETGVPWVMAGPSAAEALVRHYRHDAWSSVSATLSLPARGAAMGALAPVLTPSEPGERRSLLVAYPILAHTAATRASATSEWAADMGTHLRSRAGVRQRAAHRREAATAHGMDAKLARGNAMTRPYAVATVTVPATARVAEFGRRLDASIRRAGYAPTRLDLAQDAAFAASCVPLGVSLTRTRP